MSRTTKIGIIKDKSAEYDGFDWHDRYAEICESLGVGFGFIDFDCSEWLDNLARDNATVLLWRAWHVPWDKVNAKRKIYTIDQILGKKIFPSWKMYWHYDDKIAQLYLMKILGLPHPKTYSTHSRREALEMSANLPLPLVWKSADGAMGTNVRLIDSRDELTSLVNSAFTGPGIETYYPGTFHQRYIYLQEFVPCAHDYRIIVVDGRVALAYKRVSDCFRKNVSQGAEISTEGIPCALTEYCVNWANTLEMPWCAFDVVESPNGYQVLEFTSVFGFSATGVYEKTFGSRDGGVLEKQIQTIIKENGVT